MECQVRSMAESNGHSDSSVPQGKVQSVCRQWLVREDGMLAYKLQSEEIQHHYGHNKERNQQVRGDIQEAKVVQKTEEDEAESVQRAYERMLQEQEDADAEVARQIQERLLHEENERQRQIEETDKRIAFELQKKEKLRLQKKREEREIRQVEKVKAVQSNSIGETSCKSPEGASASLTQEAATSPLDKDFTDLCINPPSELSEEQRRRFHEEQDAELAKFLQQQELQSKNQNVGDQRLAVEAQDRELARALQERERARARRAKERAKQKALLQQQQGGLNNNLAEELPNQYTISPIEDLEASPSNVHMKENECYGTIGNYRSQPVNNIAMALDPTYNQKRSPIEYPSPSHGSIGNSPLSSPQHSPNGSLVPCPRGLSSDFFLHSDDGDEIAPPYMPIQGQRRPQTLEKTKKKSKSKEGCKTQ